jgi:hypothetical protein
MYLVCNSMKGYGVCRCIRSLVEGERRGLGRRGVAREEDFEAFGGVLRGLLVGGWGLRGGGWSGFVDARRRKAGW